MKDQITSIVNRVSEYFSNIGEPGESTEQAAAKRIVGLIDQRLDEIVSKGKKCTSVCVSPASEIFGMWHTDKCPYNTDKVRALVVKSTPKKVEINGDMWANVDVDFSGF